MKGLSIPIGVGADGGAAISSGDTHDMQIISIALGSDDNENAFQQDINLGEDMVFDLNDVTIRARILRRVYKIFEIFRIQKRFRIRKETVKWSEDPKEGALILEFKYLNLESDEDVQFRRAFTSAD